MQSIESLTPKARNLSVRLANCDADIQSAQRLRWEIFYRSMGAMPLDGERLDIDPYDPVCDHLLVEDTASGVPVVVGTYRLLRQSVAQARNGFYSAGEFNLSPLNGRNGELLELGRSCVAPEYRDAGTIQLLWRGIATYLQQHNISMMFGCGSFHGTDPAEHAHTLSYLWHNHLAPTDLRAHALKDRYVNMARLPLGSYDPRQAMRKLPPLIKAYLRVGAQVGDGAVIDHQFNTVDVFIVMPVAAISERYLDRFGAAA
jgi:L-ornithine Nalpha-acyltransferase